MCLTRFGSALPAPSGTTAPPPQTTLPIDSCNERQNPGIDSQIRRIRHDPPGPESTEIVDTGITGCNSPCPTGAGIHGQAGPGCIFLTEEWALADIS